jgi:hypothetical protein
MTGAMPRVLENRNNANEDMNMPAHLSIIAAASDAPDPGPDQTRNLDGHPNGEGTTEADRKIRQHVEDLLDQALEETFPASDPPSIAIPSGWKSA